MKKYLLLLITILVATMLVSCKDKNLDNIKMQGDLMNPADAEKLYWAYDSAYLKKEYAYYDGHYEIELILNMHQYDAEKGVVMKVTAKGIVYDSKFTYDCKMKLDLDYDIKIEEKEDSQNTDVKINGQVILYEAMCYYNLNSKIDNKSEKESNIIKQSRKIKFEYEDLFETLGLDDIFKIATGIPMYEQSNQTFFTQLENAETNTNISTYKDDYTYSYELNEDSEYEKNIIKATIDTDEEYNTSFFDMYNYSFKENYKSSDGSFIDGYENEIRYTLKTIKKSNIKRPSNYKKYIDGSFSLPI